jgi:predicted GIY-YIG superfamily endonuclease
MYPRAKIYKLTCEDGHYYYGSSCNELRVRFQQHKQDSRKHPTRHCYSHIITLGWDKVKIVLVEEFPCESKLELRKREDSFIRPCLSDPFCLNRDRAYASDEDNREWFRTNRNWELKKKSDEESYQRRKDALLAPYTCECGRVVTSCGKLRHERTALHLRSISRLRGA